MNKANHKTTGGPWYVGAQNDALYVINKPPRPSTDDINPEQDVEVIAKIYDRPTPGETDANARVMAAGWELLEACKAVEAWLSTRIGPAATESCLPKLRAAIAKATGPTTPTTTPE